jgi:uncharacterized protein YdhG (YjbR/CyaY superfamily)
MGVVDDYLAPFEGEVRKRLELVRQTIREEIPDAVEMMSYAIPTFDLNGHHVIHYAGFKNHLGLYPTPHGILAFETELAPYKKAKGSVQLPHDQPLPVELLRQIVRARVADVLAQKPKKPKPAGQPPHG